MNDNTRRLSNLAGHSACVCPMCWSSADARRYAKRRVRRAVRHSKQNEITQEINDDNDHTGDADYIMHVARLNILNARNMR